MEGGGTGARGIRYRCGVCHVVGHNAKTCPTRLHPQVSPGGVPLNSPLRNAAAAAAAAAVGAQQVPMDHIPMGGMIGQQRPQQPSVLAAESKASKRAPQPIGPPMVVAPEVANVTDELLDQIIAGDPPPPALLRKEVALPLDLAISATKSRVLMAEASIRSSFGITDEEFKERVAALDTAVESYEKVVMCAIRCNEAARTFCAPPPRSSEQRIAKRQRMAAAQQAAAAHQAVASLSPANPPSGANGQAVGVDIPSVGN